MLLRPSCALFEAIYSYENAVSDIDCESGEAVLAGQTFALVQVPFEGTEVPEAEVLLQLLAVLSSAQRAQLAKVSICLRETADIKATTATPWLWNQNSPLYEGKIWLMQHKRSPVRA